MNKPIHNNKINRVLLKPRFQFKRKESKKVIVDKFKDKFSSGNCKYCNKIVGNRIVIDVPEKDDHFWSPQLNIELEKDTVKGTVVKGVFGPKPLVWIFFMLVHFAVAVAFIVFFVMAYSNWNLNKDYSFALSMCIALPIAWMVLYFLGQLGKKKGYQQMIELDNFMKKVLGK